MQERSNVLFVYTDFNVGGIQTQILEMCKYNNSLGFNCKVLLLTRCFDENLLCELRNNAEVFFVDELFSKSNINKKIEKVGGIFLPFCKYDHSKLLNLMQGVTSCHVLNLFTYYYISSLLCLNLVKPIRLTLGFYHANEAKSLPEDSSFYNEILNSVNCLNQHSIIATSKVTAKNVMALFDGLNHGLIEAALGVPRNNSVLYKEKNNLLSVLSIGRLVPFKTYNKHILEVMLELSRKGIYFNYTIIGDGPNLDGLKQYVAENNLGDYVCFIKHINYSELDEHIDKADVFVGSGTSLTYAAGRSCICIIGIESNCDPETYGFLSNTSEENYHELGLHYSKRTFESYILELMEMPQDRYNLIREEEYKRSYDFSIDNFMGVFNSVNLNSDVYGGYTFKQFVKLQLKLIRSLLIDKFINKRKLSKNY
ncbi:glycosyltransferase [Pseudoalteromonas sp. BZB3]|uniref:glycosyltransferase n=1 Tax=Pseudoalteromonas sp. BZB3 TaxID=3136670 RepID=UPI0032C3DE3E